MIANIKVIGLGQRKTGTSQKGTPYDFVPVAFVYQDKYINGYKAETVNVDGPIIDRHGGLKLNEEVEAVMHEVNRRVYVDAIL